MIATGRLVHEALKAAEEAESDGISVEVVDPRTLQPLDEETLVASVKKTNRVRRRARGGDADGLRRRGRGRRPVPGVRLARRADRARRREVRAAAVRAGDGGRSSCRTPTTCSPRSSGRSGRASRGDRGQAPAARPGHGVGHDRPLAQVARATPVEKGEPLYELDTDKVTQEVEAEAAGVLLKIAVAEGEVPVGQTIAFIGEQGEDVARRSRRAATAAAGGAEARARPSLRPAQEAPAGGSRSRPSERAGQGLAARAPDRARARHRPLRRSAAPAPTGASSPRTSSAPRRARRPLPRGAPRRRSPAGEVERVPLTNIRKTIARRLTEAWQIPVFQLQVSADMTRVNALVARLRERDPEVRSHRHRRPHEGLRAGAHAPPRGERGVHRGRDPRSTRARTSASPSPRRRGSSCR